MTPSNSHSLPRGVGRHVMGIITLWMVMMTCWVGFSNAFVTPSTTSKSTSRQEQQSLPRTKRTLRSVVSAEVQVNGESSSSTESSSTTALEMSNTKSMKELNEHVSDGIEINPEAMVSPFAPHVTYDKFLTMQEKRVPITIRYSADSGLKPYFLTCSKKIKNTYPDVLLEKDVILAVEDNAEDGQFEIIVDGKTVVGKQKHARKERYGSGRGDMSVFVSMQELDMAIKRARKRRRPATVYGEQASNLRLELYRSSSSKRGQGGNKAS